MCSDTMTTSGIWIPLRDLETIAPKDKLDPQRRKNSQHEETYNIHLMLILIYTISGKKTKNQTSLRNDI